MKRAVRIIAADEDADLLKEAVSELEDDFDYILSGFDKMDRTDAASHKAAIEIATRLKEALNQVISEIAENIVE